MKYLLMIYGNEELWSSFPQEEFERVVVETNALQAELKASGEFVGAYGVGDQVLATTVRRSSATGPTSRRRSTSAASTSSTSTASSGRWRSRLGCRSHASVRSR